MDAQNISFHSVFQPENVKTLYASLVFVLLSLLSYMSLQGSTKGLFHHHQLLSFLILLPVILAFQGNWDLDSCFLMHIHTWHHSYSSIFLQILELPKEANICSWIIYFKCQLVDESCIIFFTLLFILGVCLAIFHGIDTLFGCLKITI